MKYIYDFGKEFEFEPEYEDEQIAVKELLTQEIMGFGVSEQTAEEIAEYFMEFDISETVKNCYEEYFLEHFESEARKTYNECKDDETNDIMNSWL